MINRECINRSSKGFGRVRLKECTPPDIVLTTYLHSNRARLALRFMSIILTTHASLALLDPLDATAERERDASFPAQALILLPAKCCEVPFGSESPKQA